MKKYFIYTSATIGFLVLALFAFYISLFSDHLQDAKRRNIEYTLKAASYIESYLQKESYTLEINLQSGQSTLSPQESRNQWLQDFSKASDLLEIIITDSLGLVFASTNAKYSPGSWILASTRDSASVDSVLTYKTTVWSEQVDSNGAVTVVSYHPIVIDSASHVLIIQPNQNLLYQTRSFKNNMVLASVSLAVVFVVMFFLLNQINNKAIKAEQKYLKDQKRAFLGQTSAELAHELKNPLAIIQSSAEALKRNPESSKGPKLLTFIAEEALRMSRLISDILTFSNNKPIVLEEIFPYAIAQNYCTTLLEKKPLLKIVIDIKPETILLGSKDSFIQLCDNLIQNAVKAMDGSGKICVQLVPDSQGWRLTFMDTGPGIPDSIKENLFDPFVSGSSNGSGLGLSIVKDLCERLCWSITYIPLEQENEYTSCFEILIPPAQKTL